MTDEYLDPPSDLPPHLMLALRIGQVCLADVWLENALGMAYVGLALGTTSRPVTEVLEAMPQSFGPRLDACQGLARERLDLTSRQRRAVRRALSAAMAAHSKRNRVVHDMWEARFDADGVQDTASSELVLNGLRTVGFMRQEATSTTLADIEQVRDELRHCHFRIAAIMLAVSDFFGSDEDWDTVEGNFELLSDDSYRLHRRPPPSG